MRRTAVFRPRRAARALAPIGVLALVAALAAGCGDDDGDSDESDDKPDAKITALTEDQIAEAVLQDDNMGEGWTSEPSTEDDDPAPGCLADIETLTDGLEEKAKGGTEFSYGDSALTVESTVTAYPDEPAIVAVFDQVQTAVAACTTVTGPDSEGNDWDLTLTYSDEATYDDVDDQYSISATGTFTLPDGGGTYDIFVDQTAVRVGQNVASISTSDLQSRTTEHAVWAEIAVERLTDVAEGEEPEPTTAPAPAGEDTETDTTETEPTEDTGATSDSGPTQAELAAQLVTDANLTQEQADCVAEKILTDEDLSDEQVAALDNEGGSGLSPEDEQEVVEVVTDATTECLSAG